MELIPKISIVITAYNRKKVLMRCIKSILSQDVDSYEIVLVDDFSTDGTSEYVSNLQIPSLRYVRTDKNIGRGLGPIPARKFGAAHARAKWVLVLDSDDELISGSLKKVLETLDTCPERVGVINFLAIDQDDIPCGIVSGESDKLILGYEDVVSKSKASGEFIKCVRKDIFDSYDFQNIIVPNSVFWLYAAKHNDFMYIKHVVRRYNREHGKGGSGVGGIDYSLRRASSFCNGLAKILHEHNAVLKKYPNVKYDYISTLAIQAGLAGRRLQSFKNFSRYLVFAPDKNLRKLLEGFIYCFFGSAAFRFWQMLKG